MKTVLVMYSNGLSGTWLTWFINQHAGFPDRLELDREFSDPTQLDQCTDYTTQANWWYDNQSWEQFMEYVERMDYPNNGEERDYFYKLAFKVSPYHEFCGPGMDDNNGAMPSVAVAHNAAAYTIINSRAKLVIAPIVKTTFFKPIYNRLVSIRPDIHVDKNPENWYNKRIHKYINDVLNVPVFKLDIGKLFTLDENEYTRLVDMLNIPKLDNWKEIVTSCVEEVYSNYNEI